MTAFPEEPTNGSGPSSSTIRSSVDDAPFGLVELDRSGRLVHANTTAVSLLGIELLTAESDLYLADLLSDPADNLLLDDSLRIARLGSDVTRTFSIDASGRRRYISLRCWPATSNEDERIAAMIEPASPDDQTAEIAALIERSATGMAKVVSSSAGPNLVAVNEHWTTITGQDTDEALGLGWLDRIDPIAVDDFIAALADSLATGSGLKGKLRLLHSTREATRQWISISTSPLEGNGAALVFFDDVTEEHTAAQWAAEVTDLLDMASDFVCIASPDLSTIRWANDGMRHCGVIDDTQTLTLDEITSGVDADFLRSELQRSGAWSGELSLITSDSRLIPVQARLVVHEGPEGAAEAISLVATDLTQIAAAQQQVAATEVRLDALVAHANDLVALVSRAGIVDYASPAVERQLGYSNGDLAGTDILELVHPDDLPAAYELLASVVSGPGANDEAELRVVDSSGTYRTLEIVAHNQLDNPAVAGVVVNARDISERIAATKELADRTFLDPLTGLPNRDLLIDRLHESLRRARERRLLVGLLFLDLDRFNVVNESLGHKAGDELLAEVANRIEAAVRPGDIVARLGGDEFAVIVGDMLRRGDAKHAARRIGKALTHPIEVSGDSAVITTSIGIAVSDGNDEPENMLRDADTALHRAKEKGRDIAIVFDDNLRDQAVRRHNVENMLRRALEREALVVHYQPVLDVATGQLSGSEALVRLNDEDGNLIMPGAFIDVAEDSGLIATLGHQVLVASIRQTAAWNRGQVPGQQPLSIAVNVSARQLTDPNYPDEIRAEIFEAGLAPHLLSIELTESALIDGNPTTERALQELKDFGCRIGLDDFGTGFSSLAYLKRFPISFLKIDRSFVSGLGEDEDDSAIVRATIALAHGLNLSVVAEGVETTEQLEHLADLDCDRVQGYLFSKPVDANTFQNFLGLRWTG